LLLQRFGEKLLLDLRCALVALGGVVACSGEVSHSVETPVGAGAGNAGEAEVADSPTCSSETEAVAGKFTADDEARWQASAVVNDVLIAVQRESQITPAPSCPDGEKGCPELDAYLADLQEKARASQACVRQLIASIGGTASDEVFTFGNSLQALLTWPQLQTVAASIDVISISSAETTTPPP